MECSPWQGTASLACVLRPRLVDALAIDAIRGGCVVASDSHFTHPGVRHNWLVISADLILRNYRPATAALLHMHARMTTQLQTCPHKSRTHIHAHTQVADEFKKKYYDVLSHSPRLFMRFFKEDSTLTVALPGVPVEEETGPEVCNWCKAAGTVLARHLAWPGHSRNQRGAPAACHACT